MWHLSKVLQGKNIVVLIDASPIALLSLSVKNDRKMKHISYHNLVTDAIKSNFVQDDKHIYFCLRSVHKIVSVNKKNFSVVNSVN